LTNIKQGEDMVALSRGERLHGDGGQEQVVVLPCLWHLNLCYRSHDISQATDFNIQEEKARYFYTMAVEFKSNKIVAMHVLQRLVYISGTNDAYVMIQNVARAWDSWLPDTIYFMSIACLVMEIFDYYSEM